MPSTALATRLSNEFCEQTKEDGTRTGVFYNAYSEDLFQWCEVGTEGFRELRATHKCRLRQTNERKAQRSSREQNP